MHRGVGPGSELLDMLEVDDGPSVVLPEVEAVEEVDVDCGGDDAVRGEQLAEVEVSRGRVFKWVMVAVREQRERKRALSLGHADMPVERGIRRRERPGRGEAELGKGRDVNTASHVFRMRGVVDLVLRQVRDSRVAQTRRGINEGAE